MNWATELLRTKRDLFRRPAFLLVASATLSLGTAVLVCAFTFVDTVMVQVPPWPNHARMAIYGGRTAEDPMRAASPRLYDAVGRPAAVVSRGIARIPEAMNVIYGTHRGLLRAQRADPAFLTTLGIVPALGENLSAQQGGAEAMVSYDVWRRWMEGDPDAVGRMLMIDGQFVRIRGVLPADYRFFTDVDMILPLPLSAKTADSAENLTAVALLRQPGDIATFSASVSNAAEANAEALRLRPPDLQWYGATLVDSLAARGAHATLWLCVGCALLVLTVAGMNVSNLMLNRTLGHAHEAALKFALGATGWRPWMPVAADALSVGLLATLIGAPAGVFMFVVLRQFMPEAWLTSAIPPTPGARVVMAALAVTLLVASVAAAGASAKIRLERLLRDTCGIGGRAYAGRAARQAHAVMLLAQTAVATLLLTLAVAAATHWWELEQIPLGFDRSHALVAELRPGDRSYPTVDDVSRLLDGVRARAARLPGVDFAGWSTQLPVGDGFVMPFLMPGGATSHVQYVLVTPGATEAMGLRKVAGRWFDEEDRRDSERVALVNEAYLRHIDGRGLDGTVRVASASPQHRRIVGIVGDTRRAGTSEPAEPTVFIPLSQAIPTTFGFVRQFVSIHAVLRGPDIGPATAYAFARIVQESAPFLALGNSQPLERVAYEASASPRREAGLLAIFAVFAVALAGVGYYSVQAIDVAARRRAFALRGALGASPYCLMNQVIRRALGTCVPGVALGLLATFALRSWLHPDYRELAAGDMGIVAIVAFAMTLTTVCAVSIPAIRAAAIEPWRVLRSD